MAGQMTVVLTVVVGEMDVVVVAVIVVPTVAAVVRQCGRRTGGRTMAAMAVMAVVCRDTTGSAAGGPALQTRSGRCRRSGRSGRGRTVVEWTE